MASNKVVMGFLLLLFDDDERIDVSTEIYTIETQSFVGCDFIVNMASIQVMEARLMAQDIP